MQQKSCEGTAAAACVIAIYGPRTSSRAFSHVLPQTTPRILVKNATSTSTSNMSWPRCKSVGAAGVGIVLPFRRVAGGSLSGMTADDFELVEDPLDTRLLAHQ